jgi:signal transduction histidine kinase
MVQISVVDTGIGIKQGELSRLFRLFGYLDSSKAMNTKGIGLGLHISKMISNQFGGDI